MNSGQNLKDTNWSNYRIREFFKSQIPEIQRKILPYSEHFRIQYFFKIQITEFD